MLKDAITLVKLTQAEIFCDSSDEFALYNSLKECREEGFEPMFVPELVDLMLKEDVGSKRSIWDYGLYNSVHRWITPSVKIKGKSKQGKDVVIYAHIPTFFSNIENFKNKERSDLYRIFLERETPQSEFEKILELEDNEHVFVHDYLEGGQEKNKFGFDEALEKTRLVSLVGGKKRAENFLERIKGRVEEIEINDSDKYLQCSDRNPKYGNTRLINFSPGEISSWNSFRRAYFIGVRERYPILEKALFDFNSLFKEVSELSAPYVLDVVKKEFLCKLKYLILN